MLQQVPAMRAILGSDQSPPSGPTKVQVQVEILRNNENGWEGRQPKRGLVAVNGDSIAFVLICLCS